MKIRTITTGVTLESAERFPKLERAARFNGAARRFFEEKGYVVQSTRIATNPWEAYLGTAAGPQVVKRAIRLEEMAAELGVSFLCLGPAVSEEAHQSIPEILARTHALFLSSKLGDGFFGIFPGNLEAAARTILRISRETPDGSGNFRFCAWAHCPPGIPFFPAAYHRGPMAFGLGLECSDLAVEAFSGCEELTLAERRLWDVFRSELQPLNDLCLELSRQTGVTYAGIDTSLAPSLESKESLALAFEKLGFGPFGRPGTLAVASVITRVLQSIPVRRCGYCGLMLPLCEDPGLAARSAEGTFDLRHLLLFSAVCGCGLDTVPLPGNISEKALRAILCDVAALAVRLQKPLSARLLLIPGRAAGDRTSFQSPYLVDGRILHPQGSP